MIYGYARVSTKHQNLDLQINALEKYGCDKIYSEKISGDYRKRKNNREQWEQLLSVICSGDTLVVWKLDRLSRTLSETVSILDMLSKKKIDFVSITDNFDTSKSYGKALLYMAAVFAQLELDLISERTIEGLEIARQQGRVGGRKPISAETQSKMYYMYYSGDYSVSQVCKECGISTQCLYNYINKYIENPTLVPILPSEQILNSLPIERRTVKKSGRPTISEETIKKIKYLYKQTNYSRKEIASMLGIGRTTVDKYCRKIDNEKEVTENERKNE